MTIHTSSLNEIEIECWDALKKVAADNQNNWHFAINYVSKNQTPVLILRLFLNLVSQGKDNPEMMKRVIGEPAYKLLMTL